MSRKKRRQPLSIAEEMVRSVVISAFFSGLALVFLILNPRFFDTPSFVESPRVRALSRYCGSIRSLVLATLLATTLAACDDIDDVHFMMEFDARVEGEPFAFETKVTCRPKKFGTGRPFHKETHFVLDRVSYGKKLKSGKGAFVAAPGICEWYFSRVWDDDELTMVWTATPGGQAILPIIYVTNDYEDPTHLRLYANPNGPDPATGVELKKCVLRPLTKEEARAAPQRPRDEHDPFSIPKESMWRGHVFLRFADEVVSEVDPGALLLETERYRLYRQAEAIWEHTPYFYAEKYWTSLWRSIPLNEAIGYHKRKVYKLRHKKEEEQLRLKFEMAHKGFADSISTILDGETFNIDLQTRGVVDVYRFGFYRSRILQNQYLRLALQGQTTTFSANPSFFEGFVLQDRSTDQLYRLVALNFRVAN